MDEENRSDPNQSSFPAAAATEGPEPIDAVLTASAAAPQLPEVEKQMSGFEKATLRWAKVAVILSALAALFVCAQWYEMHTGGADTHDLAIAAKDQAAAAKAQVEELKKETADTHDLAIAAGKQADASKAMANFTAQQFDTSQRLITSQGASISVSFLSVIAPAKFNSDGGLSINFSVLLNNDGGLAATKVRVRTKPYYSQWGENIFREPQKRQQEFCDKPNPVDKGNLIDTTTTILAHTAKVEQINFGMGTPNPSEIFDWPPSTAPSGLLRTKRIFVVVVGCVDYQSGALSGSHQTGFIFEVQQNSESDPGLPTFIHYGQEVPKEHVLVTQHFFGQGKSY